MAYAADSRSVQEIDSDIRRNQELVRRQAALEGHAVDLSRLERWLHQCVPHLDRKFAHPPLRWHDAIQLQAELAGFWPSKAGEYYATITWSSAASRGRNWDDPQELVRNEADHLAHGESLWVSGEMMDVVVTAAKTLPAHTEITDSDIPFPAGLAVLEHNNPIQDYQGGQATMSALSWGPYVALGGRRGLRCELYAYVQTVEPGMPRLLPMVPDIVIELDAPLGDLDPLVRLCATFLLLLGQPLAATELQEPPRYLRRQAIRDHRQLQPIRLITLRRSRHDSEPGLPNTGRDWSCRWVVSPFWRRQWYPSEQRHRMILVGPYVKGPADKPLVVRDKIYKWVH